MMKPISLITFFIAMSMLSLHAKSLDAYFVGNSLTRGLSPDRLATLFKDKGINYNYGSQLGAGVTLFQHRIEKHFNGQTMKINTLQSKPYGKLSKALENNTFDAFVIQPYSYWVETSDIPAGKKSSSKIPLAERLGDREVAREFIERALVKSPDVQVFIYGTWPRINGIGNQGIDTNGDGISAYDEFFYSPYTNQSKWGQAGTAVQKKEQQQKLVDFLNKDLPKLKHPVKLIPAGDVLGQLDALIRENKVPGLEAHLARHIDYYTKGRVRQKVSKYFQYEGALTPSLGVLNLYADLIHMNGLPHNSANDGSLGAYIAALTVFSVISGESPVGVTSEAWEHFDPVEDAKLVRFIQELVWDVVRKEPRTGL